MTSLPFRRMIERSADLIYRYEVAPRRGFTYVNPAALALTGYSPEEHYADPDLGFKLTHPDDRPLLEAVAQGEAEWDTALTLRWIRKDGSMVWTEQRNTPIYDDAGALTAIEGIARDVTKRMWAETDLKRREQELRSLIDNSPDAITRFDREGRYQLINARRAAYFGLPPEAIIGRNWRDLLGPDDEAEAAIADEYFRRVIEERVDQTVEYKTSTPQGERWVQSHAVPELAEDGTIRSVLVLTRDVTERHEAEARLADLARFSEENPNPVLRLSRATNLLYANPASQLLLGWWGWGLGMAAPLPLRQPVLQRLAGLAQGEFDLEAGAFTFAAVVSIRPQTDYLNLYLRDITQRRKAELRLRESEAALRKAQRLAHIGNWVWHVPENRLEWSDEMYRIFGLDRKAFTGYLPDVIASAIHPADRAAVERANLAVMQGGRAGPLEYRVVWADGAVRTVRAEAGEVVCDETGQPVLLSGIVQDITERVQAEAQRKLQAAALEAAANAIVITDVTGAIEWVNPAFCALTGYSAQEVLGRNLRDILRSGRHDRAFYRDLWDTILSGQVWRGEMINRRKDGSLYTEEQIITPILDLHGQVTHFISIKQDITERRQHERELDAVATISAAMRTASSRAEMIPILLDHILTLLGVEGTALETLRPDTGELVTELGRGVWTAQTDVIIPPGAGLSARVLASGQPYLNNEADTDPALFRPDLFAGCRAAVAVPLLVQEHIMGLLWIGSRRALSAHDLRLLTAIGDIAANALHRAALHEQTQRQLRRLLALRTIDNSITSSFDLRLTLNVLLECVTTQLGVDAALILRLDPQTNYLEYAASRGFRGEAIRRVRVRLGQDYAGRAALERRHISVSDVRMVSPPFSQGHLTAGEDFVAYQVVPLISKGQVKGVLEIFHRSPLNVDEEWLDFLMTLAGQAAIAIDSAVMFEGLQRSSAELVLAYDETIEGWSKALDLRDRETEGHTQRVTELTVELARALGLPEVEQLHIRRGALLHDIGKMGVPDDILFKPGPLTEAEWAVMRRHPELAYEMLLPIAYLRPALDIPYCHHEKWDGTGYPRGLKGSDIPLAARLFALVDVWDALSSDRPYRRAWPEDKVRAHIQSLADTHFDPGLIDLFFQVLGRYRADSRGAA